MTNVMNKDKKGSLANFTPKQNFVEKAPEE